MCLQMYGILHRGKQPQALATVNPPTPKGQPHYLMLWGLGGLDMVLAKMFLFLLEVKLQPTITVTSQ